MTLAEQVVVARRKAAAWASDVDAPPGVQRQMQQALLQALVFRGEHELTKQRVHEIGCGMYSHHEERKS